jgi:phosphoglycolate phosphatase-like HAD superfamily hydrolase
MNMTIKAVFFDIDGTLVDSNDMHIQAWDHAFRSEGQVFDRQIIHAQIGKGTDMLVPALLPDANEAQQERLGAVQGAVFKERYLDHVLPFPAARDLLVRVHETGRKVVLASSASSEELDHYMGLLDIHDLVSATTSADDVENTKPAPDIFASALAKVAPLRPDEVIVVGDTPYDIEAAGKCGIAAIGLRSGGFADDALRAAGAAAVYADVADLLRGYANSPLTV